MSGAERARLVSWALARSLARQQSAFGFMHAFHILSREMLSRTVSCLGDVGDVLQTLFFLFSLSVIGVKYMLTGRRLF